MNLFQLASNVDRSFSNKCRLDIESLEYEFQCGKIDDCIDDVYSTINEYWLAPWYCTDTWVGYSSLYVKDTLVAVSIKSSRKEQKKYFWVNHNTFELTRQEINKYLVTLRSYSLLSDIDNDNDLTGYTVAFNSQLLTNQVKYKGEKVIILNDKNIDDFLSTEVVILCEDNSKKKVSVSELEIPFRLNKE